MNAQILNIMLILESASPVIKVALLAQVNFRLIVSRAFQKIIFNSEKHVSANAWRNTTPMTIQKNAKLALIFATYVQARNFAPNAQRDISNILIFKTRIKWDAF
jgi:hypothetical protein